MPYEWIEFFHILAAVVFVAAHGAAIFMVFAIRRTTDRQRLLAVLDFSARTTTAMYIGLLVVVGTGLWMGFIRTGLFERRWYWASLTVLVLVTALMIGLAKPFAERLRSATEMRPSGVPRTSDEELGELVRSRRMDLVSMVGIVGLIGILYLMVFQPDLGESPRIALPPTTTTATTLGPGATTTTLAGEEAQLALGREVYEVTAGGAGCAACHGLDGRGTAYGPDVRGASRQDIADALEWAGAMSRIELTEEELDAVTLYISRLG
ncbi:MAG TPA: cytochrome c [Acidimicrobiia bacterium]|nr:cytochrome c [Acidimicrobiia bacterium]